MRKKKNTLYYTSQKLWYPCPTGIPFFHESTRWPQMQRHDPASVRLGSPRPGRASHSLRLPHRGKKTIRPTQQFTTPNSHRPDFLDRPFYHFRLKFARSFFPGLLPSSSPFSRSRCSGLILGVGGTSSDRTRPPPPRPLVDSLTERGNSLRRGVRTVTTFLADLRMVSLTVHSRFLAKKKSTELATVRGGVGWLVPGGWLLK